MLGTWHFRGSNIPALFQSYEGTMLLLRSAQTLTLGASATCMRSGACARAQAIDPGGCFAGRKFIDLQASFPQFLTPQIAGVFSIIWSKVLWGSSEWNAMSFPHRVPVRGEGGITECGSFTKHKRRQFPGLSPAGAGSVRAEVGGAMSAQGCNRICEARARKKKAT